MVAGCAYSFTGTNLPGHIKTIAIPNAENGTLEPSLGQEVTSGIIDKFIKDGRLKLASDTQANSRLQMKITSYDNKVHNYNADQTPQDYIVVLTMSVTLRDLVKNRDLWKQDLTHTAIYAPGGASGGFTTEPEARTQAIQDMADDLVSRTLEQW